MVLIPLTELSFSPLAHDVNSLTYPILSVHGPTVVSLFCFTPASFIQFITILGRSSHPDQLWTELNLNSKSSYLLVHF